MNDLTEETAQELIRALDNHAEAMRDLSFRSFENAADTMQSAARNMNEAAGTMMAASRR